MMRAWESNGVVFRVVGQFELRIDLDQPKTDPYT